MLGWFRRNIRKVEVLGVGVEFHQPIAAPAANPPTAAREVLPPDPMFMAQLKHLLSNTMVMIDEVSGTEAVLSIGLEGEKYRLRAYQRTEDILFGAEANTSWPVGQDTTLIETAIDEVIDTEKQKAVDFVAETRGDRKHLLSVSCFSRQRFYEFTPQQFRDWVSLHTAVIVSIDKRLRGEIRLGTDKRKPTEQASPPQEKAKRTATGTVQPRSGFEAEINRLASEIELHVGHLDAKEKVAMLELAGDASGYSVCVIGMPDGKTFLQVLSRSSWPKAVPQSVHQVAKRLDESSQTVTFQVKRLDGGAHRIMAQTVTNPLASLTADQFIEVSSEMAFRMAVADRRLTEEGLA